MQIFYMTIFCVAGATALGINCRGSSNCNFQDGINRMEQVQDKVSQLIARGQGGKFFGTGQQIACAGKICAFYQNGASGTAQDAYNNIEDLRNHGCKACGSDPTQPGNDVSTGELTVNYVTDPCCTNSSGRCFCP